MIKTIPLLCSALILAACSQMPDAAANKPKCVPSTLAGGYRIQDSVPPEAKEALNIVLAQMNTHAKLERIIEVRTQVVAGINYAITFQLDNGEVWHTVVWQDLQGNYKMTQPATKTPFPTLCQD